MNEEYKTVNLELVFLSIQSPLVWVWLVESESI